MCQLNPKDYTLIPCAKRQKLIAELLRHGFFSDVQTPTDVLPDIGEMGLWNLIFEKLNQDEILLDYIWRNL